MNFVVDEGEKQEPVTFLPIIPLAVINGCEGIATGYSTYSPCHNPIDVCNWLRMRIAGATNLESGLIDVLPWFRDFQGEIKVCIQQSKSDSKISQESTKDDPLGKDEIDPENTADMEDTGYTNGRIDLPEQEEEESNSTTKGRATMVTTGCFRIDSNEKIIVEELPVRRFMHNYDVWLEEKIEEGELKGKRSLCGPNSVYFELTGFKAQPTHKNLRLQQSFGLTNMVMLDLQNAPKRYPNIQDVLEDFYQHRYPYYQARKAHILSSLQAQIDKFSHKMKFIQLVLNGVIIVYEAGSGNRRKTRKKSEILAQMLEHSIPTYIFDDIKLTHLSEDDVENLNQKINALVAERTKIESISAGQMWLNDIDEFVEAYNVYYNDIHESPKRRSDSGENSTGAKSRKSSNRGKASKTRGGKKTTTRGKR